MPFANSVVLFEILHKQYRELSWRTGISEKRKWSLMLNWYTLACVADSLNRQ